MLLEINSQSRIVTLHSGFSFYGQKRSVAPNAAADLDQRNALTMLSKWFFVCAALAPGVGHPVVNNDAQER